jgi:hypothetical protein
MQCSAANVAFHRTHGRHWHTAKVRGSSTRQGLPIGTNEANTSFRCQRFRNGAGAECWILTMLNGVLLEFVEWCTA